MKNMIIYTVAFLQAFLLITGAILFLNSYFVDMFHFNFGLMKDLPKKHEVKMTQLDSAIIKDIKSTLLDSLKSMNKQNNLTPLVHKVVNDSLIIDSLHNYIAQIVKDVKVKPEKISSKKENAVKDSLAAAALSAKLLPVKPDSAYLAWKKQTASLYEMMEPKKAAKILQNFSDNVARDILYSMKKKKAAEILTQLNPETANRITRAQ